MYLTHQNNQYVGTITFIEKQNKIHLKTNLRNLPPGIHGFHIHEKPSCQIHGKSAKGHWDPYKTNAHKGPNGNGHLGDLPYLSVNKKGKTKQNFSITHIKKDISHHALIIHEHGDNYSDTPKKLGGGGARIACGIIGNPNYD
tara:strand:+ start:1897 stop:2322 length:426 start_codon:yes stop_codon:yes gene_type:complete